MYFLICMMIVHSVSYQTYYMYKMFHLELWAVYDEWLVWQAREESAYEYS